MNRAGAEGGESFPAQVADRLLSGENPICVYRNHRGMTQGELAAAGGIHPVTSLKSRRESAPAPQGRWPPSPRRSA